MSCLSTLQIAIAFSTMAKVKGCFPSFDDLPPPVIHEECIKEKPCVQGYQCGPYGCARVSGVRSVAKGSRDSSAFGVRQYSPNSGVSVFSKINAKVLECCYTKQLPDSCIDMCSFNGYRKEKILETLSGTNACPIRALPSVHFCTTQEKDHTQCCQQAGVPEVCQIFCSVKSVVPRPLNAVHVQCLKYMDTMKGCFYNSLRDDIAKEESKKQEPKPKPLTKFRISKKSPLHRFYKIRPQKRPVEDFDLLMKPISHLKPNNDDYFA